MGAGTGISWADGTWNPIIGCAKVSPGCTNCYAERDFDRRKGYADWGKNGTRVMTSRSNWNQLHKWQRMAQAGACLSCLKATEGPCATCGGKGHLDRRQFIFVASLADMFEAWDGPIYGRNRKLFPDDTALVFEGLEEGAPATLRNWDAVMQEGKLGGMVGRRVTFGDVRERFWSYVELCPDLIFLVLTKRPENIVPMVGDRYFPNVMFGTSIESQEWADARLPHLHAAWEKCGCGVFVSAEPLLGPVDLGLDGRYLRQVDWVITGGESGSAARPARTDWYRMLREQCEETGVPFHFKQFGEWAPMSLPTRGLPTRYAVMRGDHVDYMDERPPELHSPVGEALERFAWVGKKAAGRTLDGRIHDALPSCAWRGPRKVATYETI